MKIYLVHINRAIISQQLEFANNHHQFLQQRKLNSLQNLKYKRKSLIC